MAETPIIIRRVQADDHEAHHGGGWKIAYADFMTAMMAFFLLMWLVGATDEEQREGLADYFTPSLSQAGGRGQGVLEGQVPAQNGVLGGSNGAERYDPSATARQDIPDPLAEPAVEPVELAKSAGSDPVNGESDSGADRPDVAEASESAEQAEALKDKIERAVADAPELAGLQRHLRFEALPEGLHVQIVDDEQRSMFEVGSAKLRGRPLALVRTIGRAFSGTGHPIVITGHTDSLPFRSGADYTNWELSTDRANATRRELVTLGIDPGRVLRISGLADTEPLDAARPEAPQNRRIGILIRTDATAGPPEQALARLTLP